MRSKKRNKNGEVIVPGGVYPEDHELETARFLARLGYTIEFIVPMRIEGQKSADIIIDGLVWEMKRPKKWGRYTIEHAFQTGIKQARNILFDLRDLPGVQASAIRKIEKEYSYRTRTIRNLIIITCENELIKVQGERRRNKGKKY